MTTAVPGSAVVMPRVAAIPLPGMLMSSRHTLGRVALAASTAASQFAGFGADDELFTPFERRSDQGPGPGVVVGDEDVDSAVHPNATSRRVPPPGEESTEKDPPSDAARALASRQDRSVSGPHCPGRTRAHRLRS